MLTKQYTPLAIILAFGCFSLSALEAPLVSIKSQDEFFNRVSQLCGKAYEGNVTVDNANDVNFTDKKISHAC
jgi:hypothetical protein